VSIPDGSRASSGQGLIYASLRGIPPLPPDANEYEKILAGLPFLSRTLIQAEYAALTLTDAEGHILTMYVSGLSPEQAGVIGEPPVGHGVLGMLKPGAAPVRVHDVSQHSYSSGYPVDHPAMGPLIGAAIDEIGKRCASLYLTRSPGSESFTADDQELLDHLLAQVRVGLEIHRLYEGEAVRREIAEAAEAAKSDFLSMISHDLRSPLAAIKYLTMESRTGDDEDLDENLTLIDSNVELMTGVFTNLLDMSRIQSDVLMLDREQTYLVDIVADAVRRLTASALGKDRKMTTNVDADLPAIYADPLFIGRVLDNLITNALKYSKGDVEITSSSDTSKGLVSVKVWDEGNTIEKEDIPRLFDKFVRGSTAANDGNGTGLGLTICKSIVEAHGGSIDVTASRTGTAFTFTIPADLTTMSMERVTSH